MKQKGFTLIELLAVIVILAIIALIATPIVLNIIKDAKDSANIRSAELYADAVENKIAQMALKGTPLENGIYYRITEDGNICIQNEDRNGCDGPTIPIDITGKRANNGWFYLEKGKIDQFYLEIEDMFYCTHEGKIVIAYKDPNGYIYIKEDGQAKIVSYVGDETELSIPSKLRRFPVTEISEYAFFSSKLTSVTIPDSVTTIGEGAFTGNELTTITIPNNVIYIDDYSFRNNNLTSVTMSRCLEKYIGASIFGWAEGYSNDNITYIESESCPAIPVSESCFEYTELTSTTVEITDYTCSTTRIAIPSKLGNKTVASLGRKSFYHDSLETVTIPSTVTNIGTAAFENNDLTSIVIPNGVNIIEDSAFGQNYSLKSVTIPNSVRRIGSFAFTGGNLENVKIDNCSSINTPDGTGEKKSYSTFQFKEGMNNSNITWTEKNCSTITFEPCIPA